MSKAILVSLLAWLFLANSGHAQEGPDPAGSAGNNKTPPPSVEPTPLQTKTDGVLSRTPMQRFVCNTGYTQRQCNEQMAVLRKALANYPVAQLETWTWILVRSEDWKSILLPRGLDPDSPAFTFGPKRQTFFEEALVSQVPGRERELLLKWNMKMEDLLDFAIAHELAHALCYDANERNADRVARLLQKRKPVSCQAKAEAKEKVGHHMSFVWRDDHDLLTSPTKRRTQYSSDFTLDWPLFGVSS